MRKYLFALVLVMLVSAGASRALAAGNPVLNAEIPYAFSIGANQLPAGPYEFAESNSSPDVVSVRNATTGKEILVQSTTRLAMRDGDQYLVVFDHAGNQYYLSEIHMGSMDGYYFKAATGKHTHTTVKAKKKA